jgi:hypothetical protein
MTEVKAPETLGGELTHAAESQTSGCFGAVSRNAGPI